jgi:hypothetical protein
VRVCVAEPCSSTRLILLELSHTERESLCLHRRGVKKTDAFSAGERGSRESSRLPGSVACGALPGVAVHGLCGDAHTAACV